MKCTFAHGDDELKQHQQVSAQMFYQQPVGFPMYQNTYDSQMMYQQPVTQYYPNQVFPGMYSPNELPLNQMIEPSGFGGFAVNPDMGMMPPQFQQQFPSARITVTTEEGGQNGQIELKDTFLDILIFVNVEDVNNKISQASELVNARKNKEAMDILSALVEEGKIQVTSHAATGNQQQPENMQIQK